MWERPGYDMKLPHRTHALNSVVLHLLWSPMAMAAMATAVSIADLCLSSVTIARACS